MLISTNLAQITDGQNTILCNPSFEVNLRLMKSCKAYRSIIINCIQHMLVCMYTGYKDYDKILGVSGPNVGIPFKIVVARTAKDEEDIIMINPFIIRHSKTKVETESNCGSINLDKPIKVKRRRWVIVEYYDVKGKLCCEKFDKKNHGFTVQHEIDHVNGILITDIGGK